MDLIDLIADDVADVFLDTTAFAVSVTHRPLNNSSNDASVTAWFDEREPVETLDRGIGTSRRAELFVASSVSANVRDRWQVSSQWWETETVEGAAGGMIRVSLVRPQEELRSGMKSPSMI